MAKDIEPLMLPGAYSAFEIKIILGAGRVALASVLQQHNCNTPARKIYTSVGGDVCKRIFCFLIPTTQPEDYAEDTVGHNKENA